MFDVQALTVSPKFETYGDERQWLVKTLAQIDAILGGELSVGSIAQAERLANSAATPSGPPRPTGPRPGPGGPVRRSPGSPIRTKLTDARQKMVGLKMTHTNRLIDVKRSMASQAVAPAANQEDFRRGDGSIDYGRLGIAILGELRNITSLLTPVEAGNTVARRMD